MKTLSNDCFAEELLVKTNELETQRKEMLNHGVEFTLHDIVDKIQSHENEINKAMAQYRMTKQALQTMVANIIVEATDGRVRVPHYSPSDNMTSVVWVYVGTHWEEIPDAQIYVDFIRDACRKMELGEDYIDVDPFSKKLRKQVEQKLSKFTRRPDNEDIVLVNFLNGTLEIMRNGEQNLRPHRREDYFRYVLPYAYDPRAQCPRFQRFLDEVLPDKSIQTTILEYCAYCLVPWLHLEKIMAMLGSGSNGKSKLLEVIKNLFGLTNVAYETIYDLTHFEVHRANIEGKLINVSTENEGRIRSSAFKTLASGEPISCKRLYSQPYTMMDYAKLLFSFNSMPKIEGNLANMRRWILIKFDVFISEEDADTELGQKLVQELSGIMNMVLEVLPGLLKRKKFNKSEAIEQANRELELRNNPVLQFIHTRCEPSTVPVKGSELYKVFCEFLEHNKLGYISNQDFYEILEQKYKSKLLDHQKAFYLRVARYED